MALLTAGTKTTTSLSALVWQPSGMSATDFGNLNELIKSPPNAPGVGGDNVTSPKMWIQNGILFAPGDRSITGQRINPGDFILVDGAGWPIVIPKNVFSTSWTHS